MVSKWTIYTLTFLSYTTFHSIRAGWAGLKNMFYDPPFQYSVDFLGLLDMIVVFTLALTLTTIGHRVQHYGAKKCLTIGMILLVILTILIGALLINKVTSGILYLILYGVGVGVISAAGWPSCLYLLSQYFDKKNSTALPIWNGCNQFGDFLTLFISDIIIEALQADASITIVIVGTLMAIVLIFNLIFLPKDKIQEQNVNDQLPKDVHLLNQENIQIDRGERGDRGSKADKKSSNVQIEIEPNNVVRVQMLKKQEIKGSFAKDQNIQVVLIQTNKQSINQQINKQCLQQLQQQIQQNSSKKLNKPISIIKQNFIPPQNNNQIVNENINPNSNPNNVVSRLSQNNFETSQQQQIDTTPVNFSNVWCLHGVALYVTAYALIKSVNVIIMTWLVFYLSSTQVDLKDESRIIAILWTIGVFGGGIIGGKVNREYSKFKFIVFLAVSAAMFLTLEKMHEKIYQIQIAIAIVICSFFYGMPYNMLSTAVPIMLGENQKVKHRPGAKSAIISLMEGFGLGACGFSILLVPLLGVDNIHYVLMTYCLTAIAILGMAMIMERQQLKLTKGNNLPTTSASERQHQKDQVKDDLRC